MVQVNDVERVPAVGGMSFSDVIAAPADGRWLHIAGQVAIDPEVGLADITGDVESQTTAIFNQIETHLVAFGADLSNVVRLTVYLTSLDEYPTFSRLRKERFGDTLPVSTAVQVAGLLLNASVEIDAVAFIPA